MRMKRPLSILIISLIAVLAAQSQVLAADEAEYKSARVGAEETLRGAAAKVQLWTTSDDLMQSAAEAAEAGDFDLAIRLMEEAELHAQLALATAEREKQVWQNSVPK